MSLITNSIEADTISVTEISGYLELKKKLNIDIINTNNIVNNLLINTGV